MEGSKVLSHLSKKCFLIIVQSCTVALHKLKLKQTMNVHSAFLNQGFRGIPGFPQELLLSCL